MSINARQFIRYIAHPVLLGLSLETRVPYSSAALNLCMGTVAQESLGGTYLAQEGGPALGVGQIEPASMVALLARLDAQAQAYLASISTPENPSENVVTNLKYAFALVRLFYWVIPEPLPPNTVSGLFSYYKKYYNTPAGAATLTQWRQNWQWTGITLPL